MSSITQQKLTKEFIFPPQLLSKYKKQLSLILIIFSQY
mgnify:CR=1 FL=1